MARKSLTSSPEPIDSSEAELKCYTPVEVAEILGVTENWIREAVTARRIPFTTVGKFVRFQRRHIRAITEAGDYDPSRRGRKPALTHAA